jgi:3-methyladenine DNA glycosylase AlkD/ADP-ribose pyrophosphatase YjhB (NUDIX family)
VGSATITNLRPGIGVGVIVLKDDRVLLGKRKNVHGAGSWQFPGGHLEYHESIEECARRETLEETGLQIKNLRYGPYTNDIFRAEQKHYVTLYVIAEYESGTVEIREPERCEKWEWFEWTAFPQPLFLPIRNLLKQKFSPFDWSKPENMVTKIAMEAMHPMVDYLTGELRKAGDPEKAIQMQAYMKTTQRFYGVQAGPRRKIFRKAAKKFAVRSRSEYSQIIFELWNGSHREDMYQALEVAEHYKEFRDKRSWSIYEKLVKSAPHWDTLDWIAGKLISPLVASNRELEKHLVKWARSKNFWVRRASLLAHLHHRGETNSELLAETILSLSHEKEFFIRKAIGWILRDYSYADPAWVRGFVEENQDRLSGLSKREALKHINRIPG